MSLIPKIIPLLCSLSAGWQYDCYIKVFYHNGTFLLKGIQPQFSSNSHCVLLKAISMNEAPFQP